MIRTRGVLVAAAVVVALAGCGSAGSSSKGGPKAIVGDPLKVVMASATKTDAAKTAHVKVTVDMRGGALGNRATHISMDGVTSLDRAEAEFSMDMASMIPTLPKGTLVDVRMVDQVEYMDFGSMLKATGKSFGEEVPASMAGLKWLKLDLHGLASAGTSSSSPSSFTQYLEYLRGASKGDITTKGTETVDGVATTHYTATIDTADAYAKIAASKDISPDARAMIEAGKAAMATVKQMPIDVWIGNDDGIVRRLDLSYTMTVKGQQVDFAMREDLSDFGAALHVTAPPSDEVQDFSTLASLGRSGA